MINLVVMVLASAGLLWLGIHGLRTRAYEDRISAIETVILKVTGAEPLPITAADRAWGRASAWLAVTAGGALLVLGLLALGVSLFEAE